MRKKLETILSGLREGSIKTRIETLNEKTYGIGFGGLREGSIKTRIETKEAGQM